MNKKNYETPDFNLIKIESSDNIMDNPSGALAQYNLIEAMLYDEYEWNTLDM